MTIKYTPKSIHSNKWEVLYLTSAMALDLKQLENLLSNSAKPSTS